jgi:hypothetical protein
MVVRPHCIIGHSYMSIKSQHEKNECLFYNKGRYSLANMVIMSDVVGKSKRKILHFVAKFWHCNFVEFEEVGCWWHNQQPNKCVELLAGLWGFNYGGY